jgi:uncharacterized protein with FMN-binding domain
VFYYFVNCTNSKYCINDTVAAGATTTSKALLKAVEAALSSGL